MTLNKCYNLCMSNILKNNEKIISNTDEFNVWKENISNNKLCYFCFKKLTRRNSSDDHIIPKFILKKFELHNTPKFTISDNEFTHRNISQCTIVMCRECNNVVYGNIEGLISSETPNLKLNAFLLYKIWISYMVYTIRDLKIQGIDIFLVFLVYKKFKIIVNSINSDVDFSIEHEMIIIDVIDNNFKNKFDWYYSFFSVSMLYKSKLYLLNIHNLRSWKDIIESVNFFYIEDFLTNKQYIDDYIKTKSEIIIHSRLLDLSYLYNKDTKQIDVLNDAISFANNVSSTIFKLNKKERK